MQTGWPPTARVQTCTLPHPARASACTHEETSPTRAHIIVRVCEQMKNPRSAALALNIIEPLPKGVIGVTMRRWICRRESDRGTAGWTDAGREWAGRKEGAPAGTVRGDLPLPGC